MTDHEAIRQLAARYALAVDSRDLATLCSLFVDGDHPKLRASFEASLRGVGVTMLDVGTHVIDVAADGRTATGVVYCHGQIQDGERWIHQAILYDDTYARGDDGRWRFVRREHRLWYGAEAGVNPLTLPPANWPARHEGWGTVPSCWPTWRAFWGDDDPDPAARRE